MRRRYNKFGINSYYWKKARWTPRKESLSPNFNGVPIFVLVLVCTIPVYKSKYVLLTLFSNLNCMVNKAIDPARSKFGTRANQAVVIGPGCNYSGWSQRSTFTPRAKLLLANNDTAKTSHSFGQRSDACYGLSVQRLINWKEWREFIKIQTSDFVKTNQRTIIKYDRAVAGLRWLFHCFQMEIHQQYKSKLTN